MDAASTKPYGFMKFTPGIGVGGHCIPVDPSYLAYVAEKNGVTPAFVNLANKVNLAMPIYIAKRIEQLLGGQLKGKKILICGLAYKNDVADVRESPSILLIRELRSRGADVLWNDSLVGKWDEECSSDISSEFDLIFISFAHANLDLEALKNSTAIIFDATSKLPTAIHL